MKLILLFQFLLFSFLASAQSDSFYLLKPDRVFDGEMMHTDWVVLVKGNKIEAAGAMRFKLPANTKVIELKGATLLPGLIEGHSHLFLHPYNETSWNDQVLKEMIIATRAIVAKGAYGPNLGNADIDLPQGAAEVGNKEELEKEVRTQISKGADVVKIYADYSWGINGESEPTFTTEELATAVAIAKSSGRFVTVHSSTPEGMRRAIDAGVHSIEHVNEGTEEIFKLMKEKGVALCPTVAAGDAIAQYYGWKKGIDPEPARITAKRKSFQAALKAGVIICMGGDVGVFPHGDNAREMEMMVEYGMKAADVLRSATSVNADVFGYADKIGRIKKGLFADIIAVQGDPSSNIHAIRNNIFIMKDGKIYKKS